MVKSEASQVAAPNNASALPISVVAIAMLKTCSTDPTAVIVSQKAIPWRQGKNLDPCETVLPSRSGQARGTMAAAVRFPHYGSGAGFGSPCLRRCEKEASLSAACARSFTRESFSKSTNGFAVSMRPSS